MHALLSLFGDNLSITADTLVSNSCGLYVGKMKGSCGRYLSACPAWDFSVHGRWDEHTAMLGTSRVLGDSSMDKAGWSGCEEMILSPLSLGVPILSRSRQQDDSVEWLLPLLPWSQCPLPF